MTVKTVTIKNLITDEAKLNKALDQNGTRLANAQQDTHQIACSVLLHLGKNRDTRIVQRLIQSLPEMVRKNGFIDWLQAHAPISIAENPEVKGSYLVTFLKDKATGAGNGVKLQAAIDKPFWKFKAKEGAPYEAMKIDVALATLIRKIEKDAKELGSKVDHSALLASLKSLKVEPAVSEATGDKGPRMPKAFSTGDVLVDNAPIN